MSEKPFVSVVVGCRNSERTISGCIESLLSQEYPKTLYEVIIVDDQSIDQTPKIVKNYPVKLVPINWGGIARANNVGISHARGDIVFMTNSDCYVPRRWISNLISNYSDKTVAVGSPRVDIGDIFSFYTNPIIERSKRSVRDLGAYSCSFKKEAAVAVGLFDESLSWRSAGAEDTDFFLRLGKMGYELVNDGSIFVLHDHYLGTAVKTIEKSIRYAENISHVIMRYHSKIFAQSYVWAVVLSPIFVVYMLLIQLLETHQFIQQYKMLAKRYGYELRFFEIWMLRSLTAIVHTFSKFIYFLKRIAYKGKCRSSLA
jgi:glycosyltransferase involved in cell wall biosynthesis